MSKLLELLDVARNNSSAVSATLVIWSIVLGIIIALFITFYNRRVIGSFFRALIKAEAFDEDSAKTISEISQTENDAVLSRLKSSRSFRNTVSIVPSGDETDQNAGKALEIDENTRFYVLEEQRTRIREQFGEKSENIWILVGGVVGMIILGVLVT
ncbi:MAG: hypothetical protein ACI4QR_06105, partial [Eubacteriales bacterium]